MNPAMECVLGGVSTACASIFSNPLEVVKTRMQLQGELQARGSYKIHYRNVFHAFYTIAQVDGARALQKGLVPAVCYQAVMNGLRLGNYQMLTNAGFTTNADGSLSYLGCVAAGAGSGCLGAFFASPMYMVSFLVFKWLPCTASSGSDSLLLMPHRIARSGIPLEQTRADIVTIAKLIH